MSFGSILSISPLASSRATIFFRARKRSRPSTSGIVQSTNSAVSGVCLLLYVSQEWKVASKVKLRLDVEYVGGSASRISLWRLPDLEIVEVVRRRDLHRAAAFFRIGVFVADDRDAPADERQHAVLPIRCLSRSFCGCTATATSPSIVSGRVVATTMKVDGSFASNVLPSIGYRRCQRWPLVSTC